MMRSIPGALRLGRCFIIYLTSEGVTAFGGKESGSGESRKSSRIGELEWLSGSG